MQCKRPIYVESERHAGTRKKGLEQIESCTSCEGVRQGGKEGEKKRKRARERTIHTTVCV